VPTASFTFFNNFIAPKINLTIDFNTEKGHTNLTFFGEQFFQLDTACLDILPTLGQQCVPENVLFH
jgi:hypothetical protein